VRPFAAPETVAAPASGAGELAEVTLSLLVVLVAVFAFAWLVRRLRGFSRPGVAALEVLGETALGAKERAVLLRVGTTHLLLGVAPGRVSTLHVLPVPVACADPVNDAAPALQERPSFRELLKRGLGR
jgi:flagellar protein FliO/FliZ